MGDSENGDASSEDHHKKWECSRFRCCCSDTLPRETSIRKNCPHVSTLGEFFRFYRHFFQNAPSHHSSWSSSPSQVPEGCLSSLPQPNSPNLRLHLTARCQGLLQFSFLLGMQRRKASCLKRLQLERSSADFSPCFLMDAWKF